MHALGLPRLLVVSRTTLSGSSAGASTSTFPSSSQLLAPSFAIRRIATSSRRLAKEASTSASPDKKRKERLVILGSGWGGMPLLRKIDHERYEVSVVSPNTYFAMTPLLASAACGSLEFRATMEPVRVHPATHFYHAWCDHLDLDKKELTLTPAYPPAFRIEDPLLGTSAETALDRSKKVEKTASKLEDSRASTEAALDGSSRASTSSFVAEFSSHKHYPDSRGGYEAQTTVPAHRRAIEHQKAAQAVGEDVEAMLRQEQNRSYILSYDKLVIAVGAYNRTFGTPGVRENAHFLKDAHNARAIRWRILECFEQADHPALKDEQRRQLLTFVVCGGGPTGSEFAAELHDLIKTDLKRLYPVLAQLASVHIVDAAGGILNNFDASLATYAREKFQREGIQMKLNRKILEVKRGCLVTEQDGEIPFGLCVWSTGIAPSPLVQSITKIKKDERGNFLLTDQALRCLSAEDGEPIEGLYAIGDCAQIEDRMLPATAQVANQKAKHLAGVLNGEAENKDELLFKFKNMGSMAALGGGTAIMDSKEAKIKGPAAYVIWRSAYTWLSLSWRNRFLIPTYWFLNWVFGRDLTRF